MTDPWGVAILLGVFFVLLFLGVPIGVVMVAASVVTALYLGTSPAFVGDEMAQGLNSFGLLAIPLFVLIGDIMAAGGMARRLMALASIPVGGVKGGLAVVNVGSGTLFGFLTGSPAAAASAVGAGLIPEMKERGYDSDYSVAVTVSGAQQTTILPPTHQLVIYATAAGGVSVGALFTAGLVPGLLMGVAVAITAYVIAVRRGYPKEERVSAKEMGTRLREGFLAMLTPVIILAGILTDLFDATEAGAIACVYAALVTFFVYREIPFSETKNILSSTFATVSSVLFIIAAASAFGAMLSILRVPEMLADAMLGVSDNWVVIVLLMNVLLLALGLIMDMAPLILVMTPILLPIAIDIGMDPVQFGIMLVMNLSIGLITPPVASVLYIGLGIGKTSLVSTTRALVPFYVALVVVVLLVAFVPAISMALPNLLGA